MVGAEVLEHDQRLARMIPDRAVPLRQDAAAGGGPAKNRHGAKLGIRRKKGSLGCSYIVFLYFIVPGAQTQGFV